MAFANAGCHHYAANYAKTKWEKQITTNKPHMTNYLQKSYTIFPPPIRKRKGTILPKHLNLTSLLFVDILLQQVTSASICYRQSTGEATTLPTHG